MTSSPVTPTDFQDTVPSPSSSLCDKFQAVLLKLPAILFKFFNWAMNQDGTFSPMFKRSIIPTGFIMDSAKLLSSNQDWLLCDGSEVAQSQFPDLFSVVGTVFGTAAAGNFKLPDCRAKFRMTVGVLPSTTSVGLGSTGGEEKHILADTESVVPSTHQHIFGRLDAPSGGSGQNIHLTFTSGADILPNANAVATGGAVSFDKRILSDSLTGEYCETGPVASPTTSPTVAPNGHNTLPPYVGFYTYIKT